MYCHQTNHFPAVLEGATGKPLRQFEHPCLGSWVSYALGTANKDLPTFVNIGRPSSPVQLTGRLSRARVTRRRHFSPATFPSRICCRPKSSGSRQRDREMQALARTGQAVPRGLRHRERNRRPHPSLRTGGQHDDEGAGDRRFLHRARARQRSVWHRRKGDRRFWPPIAAGPPPGGERRPLYPDLPRRRRQRRMGCARRHEDPRAALPRRGQADFRPDPRPQAARHAGQHAGGLHQRIRPHAVVAEHDGARPQCDGLHVRCSPAAASKAASSKAPPTKSGYRAVEKPHYISDLQSTILQQVGLDYKKMDFVLNGRPFHLVEEGLGPIKAILS